MKTNKNLLGIKIFGTIILFISVIVMVFFIYGLLRISLQTGDSSSHITNVMAHKLGCIILDEEPNPMQVLTINRLIRYGAHIVLFAMLGFGLGIVLFLINIRPVTRMIAVIIDWAITYGLAYFTEYSKQFVAGRHFQMEDVRANMAGALFGICLFLISYTLFGAIHARSKKD